MTDDNKDLRRRSKAPEGIIVGSPQYWKWWRDNNKERNKLYQRRAYLKRRKLVVAAERSIISEKTLDEELQEVEDGIAALKEFTSTPVAVTHDVTKKQHPFYAAMAKEKGVTYEEAEALMSRDDYHESDWESNMLDRLKDIIGVVPPEEEK